MNINKNYYLIIIIISLLGCSTSSSYQITENQYKPEPISDIFFVVDNNCFKNKLDISCAGIKLINLNEEMVYFKRGDRFEKIKISTTTIPNTFSFYDCMDIISTKHKYNLDSKVHNMQFYFGKCFYRDSISSFVSYENQLYKVINLSEESMEYLDWQISDIQNATEYQKDMMEFFRNNN